MDIPKDFDIKWELSDVVLIAEDVDGNEKELHTNKAYLATFSSVFKTMFFSSFKEANSESVRVSCDYEIMRIILQIIYGLSRDLSVCRLDIGILSKLYKAADYFDIPAIRMICTHQMGSRPSLEMTTAVLSIASIGNGLHGLLMNILMKLSPDDLKKFLTVEDSQLLFSKWDVRLIYSWITKKELPTPANRFTTWVYRRCCHNCSENYQNARIDCTQKWPRSDVMFKTKNSDGKQLFSNKTVLATVSSHFEDLFFGSPDLPVADMKEVEVYVDYKVMKSIIAIIHHSFDIHNSMTPNILYYMYLTASKEELDIPLIRDICVNRLMEKADECYWEMAASLKLDVNERLLMLDKMDAISIRAWLFNDSDIVSTEYFFLNEDGDLAADFASKTKPIISTTEMCIVVEKLIDFYEEKDDSDDDEEEKEDDENDSDDNDE